MFSDYNVFDRRRLTLHCLITLQSPLSHIGEVTGNVSNLKTLKLLDLEGNPRQCFTYSGNALRNKILRREGIARAMSALELELNPDVHHTLFAGGRIDGSTGSDMELEKRIRQLMPWLSVLGTAKPAKVFGSKDAQMVQGRINVGSAYLICYESAGYIYEQFPGALPPEAMEGLAQIRRAKEALGSDPFSPLPTEAINSFNSAKAHYLPYLRKVLRSWTEHISVDQTTRRDSTQDPNLRKFLASSDTPMLTGDSKEKPKKSDQMISSDRLIMAGSKLYSRWDFFGTAIEEGFIYDALLAFAECPYLGGKGNRGNGLVDLEFWFQSGVDKGHLASFGAGIMSQRLLERHQRYQGYLQQYREYLEQAAREGSQELRGFLNG